MSSEGCKREPGSERWGQRWRSFDPQRGSGREAMRERQELEMKTGRQEYERRGERGREGEREREREEHRASGGEQCHREGVGRVRDAQRGPGGGPTSASLAGLLAGGTSRLQFALLTVR